jgi:hypothetical protein
MAGAALALVATGTAASASAAAASRPAAAPAAMAVSPALVAPGTGTLAYDWGCDGSYSTTTITFATNGTFTTGEGSTGLWVAVQGFLTFTFDNSETTYSSVVAGSVSTGMNTTFAGFNGCHYVRLAGVPLTIAPNADSRNAAGTAVKG